MKPLLAAAVVAAAFLLLGAPVAASRTAGPPGTSGSYAAVVPGAVVSQPFGCTPYALEPVAAWCPTGHFHSGIDLAAPLGTAVYAAAGGFAVIVRSETGYGLHVLLKHDGTFTTLYGHLSAVSVGDGAWVAGGGRLGSVGSTGMSTGPHVHLELRRDGRPVDPGVWLPLSSDSGRR
jgi:murein DD-endopeptidase MepM/ murein hydrolase activator NlpD